LLRRNNIRNTFDSTTRQAWIGQHVLSSIYASLRSWNRIQDVGECLVEHLSEELIEEIKDIIHNRVEFDFRTVNRWDASQNMRFKDQDHSISIGEAKKLYSEALVMQSCICSGINIESIQNIDPHILIAARKRAREEREAESHWLYREERRSQ
jgi:hypothetical protein